MTTTLRENNTAPDASKEQMDSAIPKRKARTTRGDKFRDSDDDDDGPINPEPKLVQKKKRSKGASAAILAEANVQESAENWDDSYSEAIPVQERFGGWPPMPASRNANTNDRRPQEYQQGSQAGLQRFPPWQREDSERPQQRQQQRTSRPQQQVPQLRPPEQPWQHPRDARPQFEARWAEDGDPTEDTWQGEDPPNRVIREDTFDDLHDRLDQLTWGGMPSAGSSFGAHTSSSASAGGAMTQGFAYGPPVGYNPQLEYYIDNVINRPVAHLPPHANSTYHKPSRYQSVVDGAGQVGAPANRGSALPPRNGPLHVNSTVPNPPSWGTQWAQANSDDWGSTANFQQNGHVAPPNAQANGFAPNYPPVNIGMPGSSRMANTVASNAASQPAQASRSSFPVSRAAPAPRRNGFGFYRGPTMHVRRMNGVYKLVRNG